VTDAFAIYRRTKTFGSLDALRAVSILAVIWHHTAGTACGDSLLGHGFLGVDMFFALSGFLIVTLLLRERDATGEIALGRFYMRRSLRIVPVYYGLLLALVVLLGFVRPGGSWAPEFFAKLPYYLTYTSNWLPDATLLAVTWSLATEEQFYLVWPPLEKWLGLRTRLVLLAGFVGLNQLLNFSVGAEHWPAWLVAARSHLEILQITFTPICLGVGLAYMLHNPRGFAAIQRLVGNPLGQLAALAVMLGFAAWPGDIAGGPRLVVQLAMTLLLGSCVVREDHALCAVCGFGPLRRLGVVSYGMYLYHLFLLAPSQSVLTRTAEALNVAPSPVALFVVCSLFTYVAAELSFRYYEMPFLRLKSRFAGDKSHIPAQRPSSRSSHSLHLEPGT
jgi:peptidoglycan/LPS O-acetylase OafA/YrhL